MIAHLYSLLCDEKQWMSWSGSCAMTRANWQAEHYSQIGSCKEHYNRQQVRTQMVVVGGEQSSVLPVLLGVPQARTTLIYNVYQWCCHADISWESPITICWWYDPVPTHSFCYGPLYFTVLYLHGLMSMASHSNQQNVVRCSLLGKRIMLCLLSSLWEISC